MTFTELLTLFADAPQDITGEDSRTRFEIFASCADLADLDDCDDYRSEIAAWSWRDYHSDL